MEERRREERYERPEYEEEREVTHEDRPSRVERERYFEDQERYEPRARHVRPVEREYSEPALLGSATTASAALRSPSMVQWSSIWGGLVAAFATMITLGVLGLAVGLTAAPTADPAQLGTTSAIWGAVVGLLSFFVGGWLAGRTSSFRGSFAGFVAGSLFWALSLVVVALLTTIGVGGILGAILGNFGSMTFDLTPGTVNTAQSVAVGTFVGLLASYIVAVLGGILGARASFRGYQVD